MIEVYLLNIVIYFFVFLIGISMGSFLNVVILRGLKNESLIMPASKCTFCEKFLLWWHKIPILSYFLLKGKCWFCKEKISLQYPLIEVLTGVLFILTYYKFGFCLKTIFLLFFISGLIVLAMTDLKKRVIIGWHAYLLIFIGLIFNFINGTLIFSILGGILGFILMFAMSKFGYFLSKRKSFGEGDFLIATALGTMFGIFALIPILIYSIILEAFLILPIFIKKLLVQKDYLTIFIFSAFIIYATLIYNFKNYTNIYYKYLTIIGFIILGVITCKRVLRNTDSKTKIRVPFGPAMSISGLIYIFFMF